MPITMSDVKEMFVNTATGKTQDAVHPITGNGLWSGLSQQELEDREGITLERLSIDEAVKRREQADRIRLCKAPAPISAEAAEDMLCALPPIRWQHGEGWEVFALGEPLTGSLLTWCCRIGGQWFQLNEEKTIKAETLVSLCKATL